MKAIHIIPAIFLFILGCSTGQQSSITSQSHSIHKIDASVSSIASTNTKIEKKATQIKNETKETTTKEKADTIINYSKDIQENIDSLQKSVTGEKKEKEKIIQSFQSYKQSNENKYQKVSGLLGLITGIASVASIALFWAPIPRKITSLILIGLITVTILFITLNVYWQWIALGGVFVLLGGFGVIVFFTFKNANKITKEIFK